MKRHKFAWNFYINTPIYFKNKTFATERSAVKMLRIFTNSWLFWGLLLVNKPAGLVSNNWITFATFHRLWKCCAENVWWPFVLCLVRFDWFVSFIMEWVWMKIHFLQAYHSHCWPSPIWENFWPNCSTLGKRLTTEWSGKKTDFTQHNCEHSRLFF